MELGVGFREFYIHLLALLASLDVVTNLFVHVLPEEPAANLLRGFITTKVTTYTRKLKNYREM